MDSNKPRTYVAPQAIEPNLPFGVLFLIVVVATLIGMAVEALAKAMSPVGCRDVTHTLELGVSFQCPPETTMDIESNGRVRCRCPRD